MFLTSDRGVFLLLMVLNILKPGSTDGNFRIYSTYVYENVPKGTLVECVLRRGEVLTGLRDVSTDIPSTRISPRNYPRPFSEFFRANASGCILTTTLPDRERQEFYFTRFIYVNPPGSFIIRIRIADRNDNAPSWVVNRTVFYIPENVQPVTFPIGYAEDLDDYRYHYTTQMYELDPHLTSRLQVGYFDVLTVWNLREQRFECELRVRRLTQGTHIVVPIRALDGGSPRLFGVVSITIRIIPPRLEFQVAGAKCLVLTSLQMAQMLIAVLMLRYFII